MFLPVGSLTSNGHTPFEGNTNDVGKTIRINSLPGSQIKWGYVEITGNSGSSTTVAQCKIKEEIVSDFTSFEWQKSKAFLNEDFWLNDGLP